MNIWTSGIGREWAKRWKRQSLLFQFACATTTVLLMGMLIIGNWVTRQISEGVINSHAVSAVFYTDSFIENRVQDLATSMRLTSESQRALDSLMLPQAIGKPIVGFRIWKGDTIVYSDKSDVIGHVFPPSPRRARAWNGHVTAQFEYLEAGHGPPALDGQPILEIYAPVHEAGTNRIIALAETYQLAPSLVADLTRAKVGSWLVVSTVTVSMILLQLVIVRRGSRTIQQQREALSNRISELSNLLRENQDLRLRNNEASRRVTELNEGILRRMGADLHDGPVQVLGATVFRLDALRDAIDTPSGADNEQVREDIEIVRESVRDTLAEIRNLSAGLAPPDVESMTLAGALETAVRRHERRTGTKVHCRIGPMPEKVPIALKSCLYRFVQEGLSNAFRHAEGAGISVSAVHEGHGIEVVVEDRGRGIAGVDLFSGHGGQGLTGLRDRIEALGGVLAIGERAGGGTRLTAAIEIVSAAIDQEISHV